MGKVKYAPPRHAHIGVIAVVPDNWGAYWQPRHQVLTRLTEYFHVAWVTPARHWRTRQLPNTSDLRDPHDPTAQGMLIWDERMGIPRTYRPAWLARTLLAYRLRTVMRRLRARGCRTFVLSLWRPEFGPALDAADFDFTCYHLDDEYSFSDVEQPISEQERDVLCRVDHAFMTSSGLFEKKGHVNPNTTIIPNGVDYARHATACPTPYDLRDVPRPRIGYTGFLKRTMDWTLLETLAKTHAEWSFVFVGPRRPHAEIAAPIDRLGQLPHVWFLPAKPADVIATYPQHFDVAIMPYRTDTYMGRYGYPLKLHEYLAAGCPVVGTPIQTVKEFSGVVELASTAEEWSTAITRALDPESHTAGRRARRRAIADQYDWNRLVAQTAEIILRGVGGRR